MTAAELDKLPGNIPHPGEETPDGIVIEDIILTPDQKVRGLTLEQQSQTNIVPSFVLRAYDTTLDYEVAMKAYVGERAKEDVEREAIIQSIARNIGGTAVVPVLGVEEINGTHWLVTEWQDGGVLGEKIVTPDNIVETLEELAGVAEALDLCGEEGIIHGDVSSKNIINGKLTDYGAARQLHEARHYSGAVVSNTRYMPLPQEIPTGMVGHMTGWGIEVARPGSLPPEVSIDGAKVTPEIDTWGLAIAIYDVFKSSVAPATPWGSFDRVDQLIFATECAPARLQEKLEDFVPPSVATLLSRMLSPDKFARPTTKVVASELRSIAQNGY